MSNLQDSSPKPRSSTRPTPRGTASYPRKRAVTACQVCRARRTKCDNLKPTCSFCLKTGAECIQSPVDLSSFDPASLQILDRLETVEGLIRSLPSQFGNVSSFEAPLQSGQRVSPATSSLKPSSVLPERLEDALAWPIFSPTMFEGDRSTCKSAASVPTPTDLAALLEQAPHAVNRSVEAFFNYVHVKNPVLDEGVARHLISSTNINGIDWSLDSCLYLLICALGCLATPFGSSESTMPGSLAYSNAQAFFCAAERRLGAAIGSSDMAAAQCLFLSGVYMMTIFQPKKAWRFFVQSLAACQDFPFLSYRSGLISDEQSSRGNTDYKEHTLEQAVYWSAWKSEREVRVELQPVDFALADEERSFYPPFFPTPPFSQDAAVDARREATAWYFYLAEISLRRLSSRICEEILALSRAHLAGDFLSTAARAVPAWEAEARQWVNSLPAPVSLNNPVHEDDVCKFVLRGHLINIYELIYWPFVCAMLGVGAATVGLRNELRGGPLPAFVLQLAEKGLSNHVERIEANLPGFRHRHHGTWFMIRTCTRSALILTASALTLRDQVSVNAWMTAPLGWRQKVLHVLDLLTHWESESPDLSKARSILVQALERAADQ